MVMVGFNGDGGVIQVENGEGYDVLMEMKMGFKLRVVEAMMLFYFERQKRVK